METKGQKRTVRIAIVELDTLDEMRAFFGGERVKARVVELPAEDRGQPARIVPFPRRQPPPLKAA